MGRDLDIVIFRSSLPIMSMNETVAPISCDMRNLY